MALSEAAELFASGTGRASSSREYRGVLRSLVRFAGQRGVVGAGDLDLALVVAYQAGLQPLAATTRHHRLLLVRQFLRFTQAAGLTRPGLAEGIRIQPLPAHHPAPAISVEESARLIRAAPDRRSRLLLLLLLGTGARISELVSCDLSAYQDGLLYLCGKSGSRAVPLPRAARLALEEEIQLRRDEMAPAPLLRSRQGRLSDRRARELLRTCCELAELAPLSPHDLRHAACARWLRAGIPLVVVSRVLGHARPSTTLDHYSSVTALDLERGLSADPLDRELARPRP